MNTESSVPLVLWIEQHRSDLEQAAPWISAAAVVFIACAASSLAALGIALAVESALLGLWAAFVALQATRDGRQLQEAVGDVKDLAGALKSDVANTHDTASRVEHSARAAERVVSRLLALEELGRLLPVHHSLTGLGFRTVVFPEPGKAFPDPLPPVILSAQDRAEAYKKLQVALRGAAGPPYQAAMSCRQGSPRSPRSAPTSAPCPIPGRSTSAR